MLIEVHFRERIVAFDGRVVELFNPKLPSRGERYHLRHIRSFLIDDPRFGDRQLKLTSDQGGGWGVELPDPMPEHAADLITAVQAALVA